MCLSKHGFKHKKRTPDKDEPTSPEKHACEEVSKFNVQRTENVRNEVKPPLRESAENLGESYSFAIKM